ncbi:hypothetical protein GCM10023350_11470 [Nocardioides endophyticus]|uniref:MFS transporter n=1 Tax=Nocardioides endophyticus TaxID=1353775 RepID=A0ABP8YH25_9ACTN
MATAPPSALMLLNLAAMGSAEPGRQGLAASVFNTALQMGGAVGLAVVTVVVAATGSTSQAPTTAIVITSAIGLIGAVLLCTSRSLDGLRAIQRSGANPPAP